MLTIKELEVIERLGKGAPDTLLRYKEEGRSLTAKEAIDMFRLWLDTWVTMQVLDSIPKKKREEMFDKWVEEMKKRS